MKFPADRTKLNFCVDIILLLLMMPIAGIGLLIKYVLVPGNMRLERYGSNTGLSLFGMDRHEWGSIHFIISIIFLALLFFHIILHWKMIIRIFRKMVPKAILRTLLAILIIVPAIILVAFPLFVKPDILPHETRHLNRKIKPDNQIMIRRGKQKIETPVGTAKDTVTHYETIKHTYLLSPASSESGED